MTRSQLTRAKHSSRYYALEALQRVLGKKQPLDSVWEKLEGYNALSPSDRAFAQLLVKTTLRQLGAIDQLINQLVSTPLPTNPAISQHILRLGITQLLCLKTKAHAAVNESVELAKSSSQARHHAGLINAVLQKISRSPENYSLDASANCPAWLKQKLVDAYGDDIANDIMAAHLIEPSLDITVKDNPEKWAKTLDGEILPTGSVRVQTGGSVTQLAGFAEGCWWVQDAAASVAVQLFSALDGKFALDICAAPGGKTAQIAQAGATVIAIDRSALRMSKLHETLNRLQFKVECVVADAATYQPKQSPDAILLDAPCSATGTLRRHPDVAWLRKPSDVERLIATQRKLLTHACSLLPAGGELVYTVCSLLPEEGEAQINWLLAQDATMARAPIDTANFKGLEVCFDQQGAFRSLPCHLSAHGGMDGFYAARLRKNSHSTI